MKMKRKKGLLVTYQVQIIKNDEQLEKIKGLSKGDAITVKGKVTDVGEVLGYYIDIDSIE